MELFEYRPIVHEEHAFRIMRLCPGTLSDIKAEIFHASLDDSDLVEYEAVSYVWGSLELTDFVNVGGKSLKITNNLKLVLKDLRLPDEDRLLWIDGICIDQGRDKEKNHQVSQMGRIYRCAERVVFHLGRSTDETPILHHTLTALRPHQHGTKLSSELTWNQLKDQLAGDYVDFDARIRRSVAALLAKPWFRRVWIVQEVANTRSGLIHWGSAKFPVADFVYLIRQLRIDTEPQQRAILDMMPHKRRSALPWSSGQDLYHLLKRLKDTEASNDHDKIFALLGMCVNGKGYGSITVDYQKGAYSLIREVVAYISFCSQDACEGVCRTLKSVDTLLESFETLLESLAIHLAITTKLTDLRSLLSNRRDEILITDRVLGPVVRHSRTQCEAVCILLAHRPEEIVVSADTLEAAVIKGNRNIIRALLTHAEKRLSFTFDWVQAIAPLPLSQELTSLWHAIINGRKSLIKQLLEQGVGVNDIGPEGLSPLGWAAKTGEENIARLLLEHHADVEAGFPRPLSLATQHGRLNVVKLLLNHEANINCRDYWGRTPLSLATSGGYQTILFLGSKDLHGLKLIKDMVWAFREKSALQVLQQKLTSLFELDLPQRPQRHHSPLVCLYHAVSERRRSLNKSSFETRDETSPQNYADYQISKVYSDIIDLLLQRGAEVESQDLFGQTPIWWAANYGYLPAVEKLLERGADVQITGDIKMSPLSWAIWNGHRDVVSKLLDSRAEVIGEDFAEHSFWSQVSAPLFWAICSGQESYVRQLLDKGLEITDMAPFDMAMRCGNEAIPVLLLRRNAGLKKKITRLRFSRLMTDHSSESFMARLLELVPEFEDRTSLDILSLAIARGYCTIVRHLLDEKVNPNAEYSGQRTPLMMAASQGSSEIVSILLTRNANANAKSSDGQSALHQAASNGHHKVVHMLLRHGAEVEACSDVGTPLALASAGGHVTTATLLLSYGAQINAQSNDRQCALHRAVNQGHLDMVRVLLMHRAEIEARIDIGTPLALASSNGSISIATLLLSYGADVNSKNQDSANALLLAAGYGYSKMVELLLKHGAELEARVVVRTPLIEAFYNDHEHPDGEQESGVNTNYHNGGTALLMAAGYGHLEVVKVLLEHGANTEAQSNSGITPLIWACCYEHTAVVRLLLEYNAKVCRKDSEGLSALDWARNLKHKKIEQILVDHLKERTC